MFRYPSDDRSKSIECCSLIRQDIKQIVPPSDVLCVCNFSMADNKSTPIVQSNINGDENEKVLVAFDTGAGAMIVTESMAKKSQINIIGDYNALLWGKKIRCKKAIIEEFKICGIEKRLSVIIKNIELIVMPDRHPVFEIFKKDKSKIEVIFPGSILCKKYIMQIDYMNALIKISDFSTRINTDNSKKIKLCNRYGLPCVEVENSKRRKFYFVFDSGTNLTIINENFESTRPVCVKKMGISKTVFGKIETSIMILKNFNMGEYIIDEMEVGFVSRDIWKKNGFPEDMCIINPLDLKSKLITLNMNSGQIYI